MSKYRVKCVVFICREFGDGNSDDCSADDYYCLSYLWDCQSEWFANVLLCSSQVCFKTK